MLYIGQVDWYGAKKNNNGKAVVSPYGFIRHKDYLDGIFFHRSGLKSSFSPQSDDWVYFHIGEGREGKIAAKNINKVNFCNVMAEDDHVFLEIFSKVEVKDIFKKEDIELDPFIDRICGIFLSDDFLVNICFLTNLNFLINVGSDVFDFAYNDRLGSFFMKFPQVFEGISFERLRSIDESFYIKYAVQKDIFDFIHYDFFRKESVEYFERNVSLVFERFKNEGCFELIEDYFIGFIEKNFLRKESFFIYFLCKFKEGLLSWMTDKLRAKMLEVFLPVYFSRLKKFFFQEVLCSVDGKGYYENFSQENFDLINRWINFDGHKKVVDVNRKNEYTFEQLKMVSARIAELAAQDLFNKYGFDVKDIAITQIEGKESDWSVFDFLVSKDEVSLSVDVKNARSSINRNDLYSEFCIPSFKKNRNGEDVLIAGVYSPYKPNEDKNIVFLGVTNSEKQFRLKKYFCSVEKKLKELSFDRSGKEKYLPVWVFSYPSYVFNVDLEVLGKEKLIELYKFFSIDDFLVFKNHSMNEVLLKDLIIEVFFLYFFSFKDASGILEVAKKFFFFKDYEIDFYYELSNASIFTHDFGMPVVFLTILTNFLANLSNENLDFDLYEKIAKRFSNIDTMNALEQLVTNLRKIYQGREKHKFIDFSIFKLQGGGLLQGRSIHSVKNTTLLAYCGGSVNPSTRKTITTINERLKTKCGYEPLLITDHESCPECHKLICPKCATCTIGCAKMTLRIEQAENQKNQDKLKLPISEPPEIIWFGYE